jgi:hypothetical protein
VDVFDQLGLFSILTPTYCERQAAIVLCVCEQALIEKFGSPDNKEGSRHPRGREKL